MRILITGATGLVGSKIREFCARKEIEINYLTHSREKLEKQHDYQGFYWNPKAGEIDVACLDGVSAIINLAGANLFRPWTKKYKKTILDSRLDSLNLLYKTLQDHPHQVRNLVSASAVGIYPSSYEKLYFENEAVAKSSFLTEVVKKWEAAADRFSNLAIDVVKLRTGIVLSKDGGAYPLMRLPVKLYVGAPLGSGRQWQSWIHLDDLARMYLFALGVNSPYSSVSEGVYNAVAPHPVNNKELNQAIAKHLKRPLWLPKIPAILIKTLMGEMGEIALSSQLVSSEKIQEKGFEFWFPNINKAVAEIEL